MSLLYGANAQQKLDEAIASGDVTALAEVSRRFFHTKAGYEATFLLATLQLDHGHPLAAALAFRRLQGTPGAAQFEPALSIKMATCWARAGMTEKAKETLTKLSAGQRDEKFLVAGKALPLFHRDEEALSWLSQIVGTPANTPVDGADQWAMFRGSPTRNTISNGSSPLLSRRWSVRTADENGGAIEEMIEQLRVSAKDQGGSQLCALHPLAVRDYVFMRSVAGLVAINFATGKRVWRGHDDDSIRQLLDPNAATRAAQQMRLPNFNAARMMINTGVKDGPRWLATRLWEDNTYGTMSSDGERLFCVEDLDSGLNLVEPRRVVNPNGRMAIQPNAPRSFNRLAAYDIATEGKLKWEAGGPVGEARNDLAGAFFLGPPLPLADSVYALTELKGEIRLVAIDANSGKLEWSQQLAVLESVSGFEQMRRTAGVSPSFSDGVLFARPPPARSWRWISRRGAYCGVINTRATKGWRARQFAWAASVAA